MGVDILDDTGGSDPLASGFVVFYGNVALDPVILIQAVRANLESFGRIDKTRLLANTFNSGFRISSGSINADQLLVRFPVSEFMYVPQQEDFIHENLPVAAGVIKYINAQYWASS